MDAAIHIVVHPLVTGNHDAKLYYLPSKVAKLQMHPRSLTMLRSSYLYSFSKLVAWCPGQWNSLSILCSIVSSLIVS